MSSLGVGVCCVSLVDGEPNYHRLTSLDIVKASSGPRYLVGIRNTVPKHKLKSGVRVSLDMTTLTIMRILPREVDPLVYNMSMEDPAGASFAGIGGLSEQIRELREVIELPLLNPELFLRVGIKPPKGVLLYGPPGTGKTLLARAVAATLDTNFLKVVSSAIVDKYIGESARLVREMFGYAKEHEPVSLLQQIFGVSQCPKLTTISFFCSIFTRRSSSWTKSMPSEEGDSVKEQVRIERFREH